MRTLFLTGDISGGEWASIEFGRSPWDDDAYFYSISPLSLAAHMHTPLLIQHSERDLRTTVGPGRGAVHGPPLAQAAGPVHARPGRDPRADPLAGRRSGGPRTSSRSATGSSTSWSAARRAACPAEEPRGRSRAGRARRRAGRLAPMTTSVARDSATRERAHELIRAYDGRAGSLGTLLGRVTPVDRSGSRSGSRRSEAVDQEGIEGLGARPRDPDDGSHDARGEGHAGQGPRAVPEGHAPAAGRRRRSRTSPRSASTRPSSPRPRRRSRARA